MILKALPPPSSKLLFFPASDDKYVHFEDAQHHPFDHSSHGFERVNAWWLADAALLAYWDEAPARTIWSRAGLRFQFVSAHGGQCHIGYNDAFVIVAFRGTQPDDWHDLYAIIRGSHVNWEFGGRVHHGFRDAHKLIWPDVQTALKDLNLLNRPLWLTGHSLGAALATLSMDCLGGARGLYTIGSPPVGDRRFADSFNRRHGGKCFRYVNHADIVVHLPRLLRLLLGSYAHVRERRYIDRRGAISKRGGPSFFDWCSLAFASRVAPKVGKPDDIIPLPGFLVDHTPRRYAVHIWNDYAINSSTSSALT